MIEDHPTPHLLMRENVQAMKRGSVLVDVAIDQGGSAETSRPTTISNPTYIEEDVVHYCVPNMPALVPRSATRAFQNQVLPFIKLMLRDGVVETLQNHPYLVTGLSTHQGKVVRGIIADVFGVKHHSVEEVLK
ncbi:alanine dehydrogenase 1 [bacterium BMS3Bbin04]|nr:alanine dehydrogenase 1 [bacterium BMS3Bbin04]